MSATLTSGARWWRRRQVGFATLLVVALMLAAVASAMWTDSAASDATHPSALMGLVQGARRALFVGGLGSLLSVVLGVVFGGWAALRGGLYEAWLNRVVELIMTFPAIVWVVLLARGPILGPSWGAGVVALSLVRFPTVARSVRTEILHLRQTDVALAARALGLSSGQAFWRHLLPHLAPLVVEAGLFGVAILIALDASLGLIGVGVLGSESSWGTMAMHAVATAQPRLLVSPVCAVACSVGAFSILAEEVRDRLDPRRGG